MRIIEKNKSVKIVGLSLLLVFGISLFVFSKNPKTKLDPESKEFYNNARYLFTRNERKVFLNLRDNEARKHFIKLFWEIRDPSPESSENEFKEEMEERFLYISKYLKEGPVPGWKTDRGRIYILLGPPHSKEERNQSYGSNAQSLIYWYYQDSNIFVLFVDEKGFGSYRMDLRRTSLRLVDELKRRKYYINTDNNINFETAELTFSLKYDKNAKKLLYKVNTGKIFFKSSNSKMMTKLKVDFLIYIDDRNFSKKTEIRTIYIEKDELLKKKVKIKIEFQLDLPKGKIFIDTIITDLLGDAVGRKPLTFKVK